MLEMEPHAPATAETTNGTAVTLGSLAVWETFSPDLNLTEFDQRAVSFLVDHAGLQFNSVAIRTMTGLEREPNAVQKLSRTMEKLRGNDVWSDLLFEDEGHSTNKFYGIMHGRLTALATKHGLPAPAPLEPKRGFLLIPEKSFGRKKRQTKVEKMRKTYVAAERLRARRLAAQDARGVMPPPPTKRLRSHELPKRV